jgi:hypothetical protein
MNRNEVIYETSEGVVYLKIYTRMIMVFRPLEMSTPRMLSPV